MYSKIVKGKGRSTLNQKLVNTLLNRIDEVCVRESLVKKELVTYLIAEHNNSEFMAKVKADLLVNNCIDDIVFSKLLYSFPTSVTTEFYITLQKYLTFLDIPFDITFLNVPYEFLVLIKSKLIAHILQNEQIVTSLLLKHSFILRKLYVLVEDKPIYPLTVIDKINIPKGIVFFSIDKRY